MSTILPNTNTTEERNYSLIHEANESGTIILGSRFLIRKFFESGNVGSDGTFKMAPIGYTQVCICWSLQMKGLLKVNYRVQRLFICCRKARLTPFTKKRSLYSKNIDKIITYLPYPGSALVSLLINEENAVQNVVAELYSFVDIKLWSFHVHKNTLKCLVEFRLIIFVKKCKGDRELWFYGQFKQILDLPYSDIHNTFKSLKLKIVSFFEYHFDNEIN